MRKLLAPLALAALTTVGAQDHTALYEKLPPGGISVTSEDGRHAKLSPSHPNMPVPTLYLYLRSKDERTRLLVMDKGCDGIQPAGDSSDQILLEHQYLAGLRLWIYLDSQRSEAYSFHIRGLNDTGWKTLHSGELRIDDVPRLFRGRARKMNERARDIADSTWSSYLEQVVAGEVPNPFPSIQSAFDDVYSAAQRAYDGEPLLKTEQKKLHGLGLRLLREAL